MKILFTFLFREINYFLRAGFLFYKEDRQNTWWEHHPFNNYLRKKPKSWMIIPKFEINIYTTSQNKTRSSKTPVENKCTKIGDK